MPDSMEKLINLHILFFSLVLMTATACQSTNEEEQVEKEVKGFDVPVHPDDKKWPARFGFGNEADRSTIKRLDISIAPDGTGLPAGKGFADQGAVIYKVKCVACHGSKGWEGPFDQLVSDDSSKAKTIGNYWPYATTVFDYIRRAMPYNAPGSLSDEEVYQLTAFLLYANGIVKINEEINAKTLPKIEMPAKKFFVVDDRKGGHEVY
ncbi:cytochrome c [Olivibacter domesticus]|uniref:Cytochrome c n=2 Tax=Olivibacter domesticus TaxID=407022 RepID=A0A1H7QWZ5_OLID1|nr:cytochrome c [Olivibacter domesticus]